MPSNVYNANWFAGNLVRKYPLDSTASCIDTHGNYLLDDIITDINISYPKSLGEYCYIASVNVTTNLVSILIACGGTPIAACCVPRPTAIDRYYTLDSLYEGVAGVIAFGLDSINTVGKWSFINDGASRILPTCCTVYEQPAVLSLCRVDDSEPLTGDILFTAGKDIELSTHYMYAGDKQVKAIFIGLNADSFKEYITDCEKITEADTCKRRYVASFGGAVPNCDGEIEILSDTINIDKLIDGVLVLSTDITVADMCGDANKKRKYDDDSDSSSSNRDQCPFDSPISPNICGADDSSSSIIEVKREVSPLILRSKKLDLSLNYVNLYTSEVSILSGGAVYGEGTGFVNAGTDNLEVSTHVNASSKIDVQLVTDKLSNTLAKISIGNTTFEASNGNLAINEEPLDFKFTSDKHYHIVFTPTLVMVEDESYTVLAQKECTTDLSNDIFVTINGIKCETIAYE